MSSTPQGPDSPTPPRPRRRRLVAAAVGAVLVAALVVLGSVLGRGEDATAAGSQAAATSAASPSASPTGDPATTDPTAEPGPAATPDPAAQEDPASSPAPGGLDQPPPSLPAVPLDEEVPVQGVTASLTRIESIQGEATGPGNVNGPALRVTVRLANGTGADLGVDGVTVDLVYGADRTPGSPLDDVSQAPFAGVLRPGEAAEGTYVFRVPSGEQDDVTIGVGSAAGAPIAVFTGSPG